MKSIIISTLLVFIVSLSWGQSEKKLIRKGNKSYEKGEYQEAEIDYIKAVQSEEPTHKGLFNLGDALFQQDNFLKATAVFDSIATMNLDEENMSKVYYNLGNSLLKLAEDSVEIGSKVLPASIESYKNSLRINPDDYDAKYNLAYAQKLLEQQQNQQQEQKQDQEKQDDKKDKQDEQDQKDQQNQENKDQENQDKQDQQDQQDQQNDKRENKGDQQQQGQPKEISKEDAERMLEALKNDEKKTLDKLKKVKAKAAKASKSEKDW